MGKLKQIETKGNFKQGPGIKHCFILAVILTPWFWFFSPPKNWLKPEIKNNLQEARLTVIWERGEVGNTFIDKLFSNWPAVFVRRRLAIAMENLDIGNYFFAGHPRARVGIKENQKFFFFQLLFFLIGFTSKKLKRYTKFLIIYSLSVFLAAFVFKWRDFNQTILFSAPFLILISLGMERVFSWPKKYLASFVILAVFETTAFLFFFSKGLLR